MLDLIEADELDVAFSLVPGELPDGVEGSRLERGGGRRGLPARDGTASSDASSAADLAGVPLATPRSGSAIKRVVDAFFAAAGERSQLTLESGDPYLIRCLVSDGFGAAILPASITRREGPPVETRPLRPAVRLPVYLIWRRDRHRSPAAAAFIEFVRSR